MPYSRTDWAISSKPHQGADPKRDVFLSPRGCGPSMRPLPQPEKKVFSAKSMTSFFFILSNWSMPQRLAQYAMALASNKLYSLAFPVVFPFSFWSLKVQRIEHSTGKRRVKLLFIPWTLWANDALPSLGPAIQADHLVGPLQMDRHQPERKCA